MGTELRVDSWYRYMLYKREAYLRSVIASEEERKEIDVGQKFALAAYPDIWADDAELVERVRRCLGDNFY